MTESNELTCGYCGKVIKGGQACYDWVNKVPLHMGIVDDQALANAIRNTTPREKNPDPKTCRVLYVAERLRNKELVRTDTASIVEIIAAMS